MTLLGDAMPEILGGGGTGSRGDGWTEVPLLLFFPSTSKGFGNALIKL